MRRALRGTNRALCGLALVALLSGCVPWDPSPPPAPSATGAGFPCPAVERPTADSPRPVVASGRVGVGRVSYPLAPAPFEAPSNVDYIPFANLVGAQHANVERSTASSMGWDAVVLLARLSSVDGAWGAQRAAEVVAQCSLSMTWLGIDYHPRVTRDEASVVDGHEAWIRVTELSFTVPGIRASTEVQTVIILQTEGESYAYLSYLPDTAPQLKPVLDATREGLRVA